jgi:uncharacterized protein (DUF58 family)
VRRVVFVGGLVILLFFAYLTAIPLAYKMIYAAVLVVGASWLWTRFGARGLRVRREPPEGAYQAGEAFTETLMVENRSRIGLPWVEVIDRSGLPGYDAGRAISLGPRRSRRWMSQGRFQLRGKYAVGPMEIVTGDPFGIFTRTERLTAASDVTVYPRLVDLAGLLPGSSQTTGDATPSGRLVDAPPDAYSIREHDPQDGFNRIHWPSTARLGRPMSKSFEKFEGSDLLLLLDLERDAHRGTGVTSTLEYAVSLAASVAVSSLNHEQAVGLMCNDRRLTTLPAARGGQHLRRTLDFLAVARADGTAGLEALLRSISAVRGSQSLVVITPNPGGKWVDHLVEAGRHGARRSTVFHLDRETFEAGAPVPGDALDSARVVRLPPSSARSDVLRWFNFTATDRLFTASEDPEAIVKRAMAV